MSLKALLSTAIAMAENGSTTIIETMVTRIDVSSVMPKMRHQEPLTSLAERRRDWTMLCRSSIRAGEARLKRIVQPQRDHGRGETAEHGECRAAVSAEQRRPGRTPTAMIAASMTSSRPSRPSRLSRRGRASVQASPRLTGRPRTERLTTMVSTAVVNSVASWPMIRGGVRSSRLDCMRVDGLVERFAAGGVRVDRGRGGQDEAPGEDLGELRDDRDGQRQAEDRPPVGARGGDRAVEDLADAQRAQRDDARLGGGRAAVVLVPVGARGLPRALAPAAGTRLGAPAGCRRGRRRAGARRGPLAGRGLLLGPLRGGTGPVGGLGLRRVRRSRRRRRGPIRARPSPESRSRSVHLVDWSRYRLRAPVPSGWLPSCHGDRDRGPAPVSRWHLQLSVAHGADWADG